MGKLGDLRWQQELEDHMEGPIEDRVEGMLRKRLGDRFEEATFEEKEKIRQEIRAEILNKKRFSRMYEEERHLDELQVEQREYDAQRFINTSDQMWDRLFNQDEIMWQEKGTLWDLGQISPNSIVSHYEFMANLLNIRDANALRTIIEKGQDGNIDGNALKGITESQEIQQIIDEQMEGNGGNLNIEQLLDIVTRAQKQNAQKEAETLSEFMDVAKKDIDTRVHGVERKNDALTKIAEGAAARDEAFYEALDIAHTQGTDSVRRSEGEVGKKIKLGEIEVLTEGVKKPDIDAEISAIRAEKTRGRDEKQQAEKE